MTCTAYSNRSTGSAVTFLLHVNLQNLMLLPCVDAVVNVYTFVEISTKLFVKSLKVSRYQGIILLYKLYHPGPLLWKLQHKWSPLLWKFQSNWIIMVHFCGNCNIQPKCTSFRAGLWTLQRKYLLERYSLLEIATKPDCRLVHFSGCACTHAGSLLWVVPSASRHWQNCRIG